jgi:hypothetical protein
MQCRGLRTGEETTVALRKGTVPRLFLRRSLAVCIALAASPSTDPAVSARAAEPSKPAQQHAAPAEVDLGKFARVITSDPNRVEGTKARRLDEFPAADVFLTRELAPRHDDLYSIPAQATGRRSIGLEWAQRRVLRRVALEFPPGRRAPSSVELEYWSSSGRVDSWEGIGQTPWQGRWERLPANLQSQDGRLVAAIPEGAVPEFAGGIGVLKVRWLFSTDEPECVVRRPSAFGPAAWHAEELLLESQSPAEATVAVYNGLLIDPAGGSPRLQQTWNASKPLRLGVVCSQASSRKADRTLLRLQLPAGLATVAVDDALSPGGVYLRDFGVRVRRAETPQRAVAKAPTPAEPGTILSRVRKMPDQSFDQAMRALWRPIQNRGPTMLSLACDNEKFIVDREGGIRYGRLLLRPRFAADPVQVSRLDFGVPGVDTAVRPLEAAKALPLRIGQKTYAKGIGLHANAEVCVQLDGRYEVFQAEVGVLPSKVKPGGSVVFQVDVDGERRFDSGVMRQETPPRPLRVALKGAGQLVLRVGDAGDGIVDDAANWAEARLVPAGLASKAPVFLSDLYARQLQSPSVRDRRLEDRWMPVLVNTTRSDKGMLRQRTWVAPLTPGDPWATIGKMRCLAVAEFTLENSHAQPVDVALRLALTLAAGPAGIAPVAVHTLGKRIVWTEGDRLLAVVDAAEIEPPAITASPAGMDINGRLPASATRRIVAYIPAWPARKEDQAEFPPAAQLRKQVARHWQDAIAPAMQIEVPEPLLEDVYRATQVHCLMAARNEDLGRRVAPWCASDAYGPLDTEAQPVILGMSLVGHGEFARRGLDFFVSSYNADGLLVKGYTLIGTGQHLWTLEEFYARHPDRAWLAKIAPEVLKSCRWILRQTEKTKSHDPRGERMPEYGLTPPGVLADWNRYAYYFYGNAQYSAGLNAGLRLLAEVQPAEAEKLRRPAAEYRKNVLRAFRWQRSRMPVVPLRDGTWVSPCPSSLYCYGLTREFFGGVSATGHDVEAGGNHLIPLGLLDPKSREADAIVDYLEDRWFLIDGIFGAYPAQENENDWFNRGGFSKLQPHYSRTAEIHALRDDVKPFVRTYFNTFPVLLNRENLSYWEHMNNGGAWNKTHESAWFLQMTRTMLLTERGNELWLAPFVTHHWMQPGMRVAVRNAPTRFGVAGYTLRSAVDRGCIEADVQSPTRNPPARLVLRVRHPQGKPMRRVTVDGASHVDFDPATECVRLVPKAKPIAVRVMY